MKLVGNILAVCVLLALLRFVIVAALSLCLLALLWGVFFRPGETFGLLATLLVFGLVGAHPVACIVVAGLAFVSVKLGEHGRAQRPRTGPAASPPAALQGRAGEAAGGRFEAGDG